MDNFKPLDLFEDGISSEMHTEESAMQRNEETPLEDNNCVINETDTATTIATTDSETENKVSEGDSLESLDVNDKQEEEQGVSGSAACCNDSDGKVEVMIQQLMEQVSSMETLFNKRIMHTDYEDKVIDQMHSELQKYKEDLYSQLVRPILLDVIEVRDSIIRIASTYLKNPEGEQDIPNKTFADYSYDLQDILEKNNVEIYRSESGDAFVPVRQRAVKKEITNDESLHGKVAESLSSGYSYGGRIISAEKVSVYFYQESNEEKYESEESLNG